MEINYRPYPKQHLAFQYLTGHPEVSSILYGGAASGGKSHMAAAFFCISALKYPGTRWFVGRATLRSIKQSILVTFQDLLKSWKVKHEFNGSDFTIRFDNGSIIIFRPLAEVAKNPDSLGSIEVTGAFIEEASEVSQQAAEILTSRIRYKLDDYGLAPKLLMTCNPSKGWLYSSYYLPWQNGTLPSHKVFIPALWSDNPSTQKAYVQSLMRLDEQNRKRLLEGSWDYDDSDQDLFSWKGLNDCFTERRFRDEGFEKQYITVDPAGLGKDKTVIIIWYGYYVEDIIVLQGKGLIEVGDEIKAQMAQHNIRAHKVAIDANGYGDGVKDYALGGFGVRFLNNAAPFRHENYKMLKTQVYFKMAEMLNKISFAPHLIKHRDTIIQEMYNHKRVNIDSDGKLEITKKENVKTAIGHSPDFSDALAFRFYWPCKNKWDV